MTARAAVDAAANPSANLDRMPTDALPALVALAGPTASGKSAAALLLAQAIDGEIVSVDSALVYRLMDIGTAKPTREERALVPHHLVDIRDPAQAYSAAEFAADARRLVGEIRGRGKRVVLAGGTMLYFKALFEGLAEMPAADAGLRAEIEREAAQQGWPALHAQLAKVDPRTAARLAPQDAQRIQRALEVYYVANKPLSELLKKPKYVYFPYTPLRVSLVPSDREVLHTRIAQRFEAMLEAGLVTELKKLREEYALEAGMPSMRCVGYRQAWDHLEGRIDAAALREQGIAATRQFAKRQLTWLRAMEGVTEFDCLTDGVADLVIEYIRRELEALLVSG